MKKDYSNYYLDISSLKDLDSSEKDTIHSYYRDMLCLGYEGRHDIASSYFNTLDVAGHIKNRTQEEREKKIDLING